MDDDKRYTALLLRHRKLVWRQCMKYAGDDMDRCADLVQEVSLSLWERFGRLRPGASFLEERAWVAWCTRTVLHDLHRRRPPDSVPLADWMAECIPDDSGGGSDTVEELLSCLSEEERRLLQMRLDGYRADEIGERMGLTRNNVYQRIYKIIKKLKDKHHAE